MFSCAGGELWLGPARMLLVPRDLSCSPRAEFSPGSCSCVVEGGLLEERVCVTEFW